MHRGEQHEYLVSEVWLAQTKFKIFAIKLTFNVVHFCVVTRLTIFIYFFNDSIQLLSGWVLTQHPHDGTQLLGADITATIGVEHVEGSLELFEIDAYSLIGQKDADIGDNSIIFLFVHSPASISSLRYERASCCASVFGETAVTLRTVSFRFEQYNVLI